MEGASLLSPLGSHNEVAALILRYLEPRDLAKLLLLNYGTHEWLLSPVMNYFWYTEVQKLPRGYHIHKHPATIADETKNPCKRSPLRLEMRNLMCRALCTPTYCNWLRNLKCQNWSHYHRLPSYDSYWHKYSEKLHNYDTTKNYFEIWKKKAYLRLLWWAHDEHPSSWLSRQEHLLLIKSSEREPRRTYEEKEMLMHERFLFYEVKDGSMPSLIKRISNKAETFKRGITENQKKHSPWVAKRIWK